MTERQLTFARLLGSDPLGNKTQAAIGAGCTSRSASVTATKWLKKASVQAEIERVKAKVSQKLEISAEEVLLGLKRVAFADIRKAFNEDGTLKAVSEWDDDTAGALAGIEHEKLFEHYGKGQAKQVGTTTKVKLSDRIRALELLGRWKKLNLFAEEKGDTTTVNIVNLLINERRAKLGDSRTGY